MKKLKYFYQDHKDLIDVVTGAAVGLTAATTFVFNPFNTILGCVALVVFIVASGITIKLMDTLR